MLGDLVVGLAVPVGAPPRLEVRGEFLDQVRHRVRNGEPEPVRSNEIHVELCCTLLSVRPEGPNLHDRLQVVDNPIDIQ